MLASLLPCGVRDKPSQTQKAILGCYFHYKLHKIQAEPGRQDKELGQLFLQVAKGPSLGQKIKQNDLGSIPFMWQDIQPKSKDKNDGLGQLFFYRRYETHNKPR